MQAISLKHLPVKPCSTPAMSWALSALIWSLSTAMRALLFFALIDSLVLPQKKSTDHSSFKDLSADGSRRVAAGRSPPTARRPFPDARGAAAKSPDIASGGWRQ